MKISIEEAAKIILDGEVVVFPTETVYGIGANAEDRNACLKIYEAKNRPAFNPLIIHVNSIKQAKEIAIFNDLADKLANKLWPGPLTIILPQKSNNNICDIASAGLKTIAIRIPAQQEARKLLSLVNKPIAAPSANKSGMLSATSYAHANNNFPANIPIIKSDYHCKYGLESTIIDLSDTAKPTILRLGFISKEILEDIIDQDILIKNITYKEQEGNNQALVTAPGQILKHYSPKAKLRINATKLMPHEIGLNFKDSNLINASYPNYSFNLSQKGDLAEAATNLYHYLFLIDQIIEKENNLSSIAIAPIENKSIGAAINDRIFRASQN